MKTKDIVKKYLIENGYEGFFNEDDECGCNLENIFDCGNVDIDCQPGYIMKCDCGDCDYHIGPVKS